MVPTADLKPDRSIGTDEIDSLLQSIVKSKDLHFRWLNTLSMLEHIGARKIHTTQTGSQVSEMVLRHASEEARHASFFKRLALKVLPEGTQDFQKGSLLAGYSAVSYFQKLDSCVERSLSKEKLAKRTHSFLCYLYVTKMIEERAGLVYELYDKILDENQAGISIKGIIKEEEVHLVEMDNALSELDPDFEARTLEFRGKEAEFFHKYFRNLEKEILRVA
ncbi:hypothetical protein EHQ53_03875 [Leptospira langatensis]|uniref:Rubrerythrin n=1 Tax=Leptospira langatensis TaxID=2484983 RepID=A0A5F1ZYB3_9LEPT|nr:hypothetical protein [Leptospira langatensis]TGK04296.1 hypothetical protein EHO57_04105 [Leptospira langatensis]TGL43776.1 hypothetical protein EHQ53_03875 [Leptospira langatensis]